MILYNMMEKLVLEEIEKVLNKGEYNGCTCERCKADMMALALNKLPAKYVVTEQGEIISKIVATLPQNQVDLLSAVIEASELVKRSPRHPENNKNIG